MQNLFLDTNILGQLCHPSPKKHLALKEWFYKMLKQESKNHQLCLPEIADYELRRKLNHIALQSGQKMTRSLERLNNYHHLITFVSLEKSTLQLASQLWAEARYQGLPTAHPESLDGDVILAAQAKQMNGIVLTTNKKHLSRFVPVADWDSFKI